MDKQKIVFHVVALFIVYAFSFALSYLEIFRKIDTLNYVLMPLFAYVAVFYSITYLKNFFPSIEKYFLFVFVIFSFLAFYIQLIFFYYPVFSNNVMFVICVDVNCSDDFQLANMKAITANKQLRFVDFLSEFKATSFSYFTVAGILSYFLYLIGIRYFN